MTLGAENIETSGLENLFGFESNLIFDSGELGVPGLLVLLWAFFGVQTAFCQCIHGQKLGVSTEHDVGTAASHVGGDGNCGETTRLCDNRGFASVVLGIQNLVANAALSQ